MKKIVMKKMKIRYKTFDVNCDKLEETFYEIAESDLIKPEDLKNHIGETLMFHNGYGGCVSAVLTEAVDVDEWSAYSYVNNSTIDYEDELDMSYYHNSDDVSRYETLMYTYVIRVQGIHHDQIMHVKYVSKMTDEATKFRKFYLEEMNVDELISEYIRLGKLYDSLEEDEED